MLEINRRGMRIHHKRVSYPTSTSELGSISKCQMIWMWTAINTYIESDSALHCRKNPSVLAAPRSGVCVDLSIARIFLQIIYGQPANWQTSDNKINVAYVRGYVIVYSIYYVFIYIYIICLRREYTNTVRYRNTWLEHEQRKHIFGKVLTFFQCYYTRQPTKIWR